MKLESIVLKATATIIVVLALSGCGQDDITLPDAGSSAAVGECGAWYPGGGGDGGATYGFDVGDTLPCFVWESVRIGEQGDVPNAYLSMGELLPHGRARADGPPAGQVRLGRGQYSGGGDKRSELP